MSPRDELNPAATPVPEAGAPRDFDPRLLQEAFEQFVATSRVMERAYHELQAKVEELDRELEDKNRQLSEQLAAAESARTQLADVLASLDLALAVFDSRGRLAQLNRAGQDLFGYAAGEAVGLSLTELFGRRFTGLSGLELLAASNGPAAETEIGSLDDPAGRVLRVSAHRMRGMGEAEGRIVLAEDVTDVVHRRVAAARNQRLAAMGEMAVQIVHQIRNPMGSIELFASMLRRDLADSPDLAALAGKVQQGIRSLNLIIGNLLSFARGAEPDARPVDLQALIDAAIGELDGAIRQRGIRVAASVRADAAVARVDPELWRQALLNLLDNAVQAMPGGGELTVAASREAPAGGAAVMRLTVADTGGGMSASVRERVFNPFFTTKERGAGLGLALVHNIVKAHGGAIEVESAEGQGSKFTITLPA